jgi:hypothetical protein
MIKFVLISLISLPALADVTYVPKSMPLYDGGNEFNIKFDYFQSLKNIDSQGNVVDFSNGESYYRADLDMSFAYGMSNDFQIKVGGIFRANASDQRIGDEVYSFSNSGAKSTYVQFLYRLPKEDKTEYTLEANYEYKLFQNSEAENVFPEEVILGDDGTSISIGLNITHYFKSQNFITARGLYRNPGENLSSEWFTQIEGGLMWNKFSLIGGLEYVASLDQDAYGNDPENKPRLDTGNTSLYNSINRSWTAPYLGINIALGDVWRFEFMTKPRIAGNSTDIGNNYLFTLARRNAKNKDMELKYSAFKEYTVEANIVKVSKTRDTVIIDAGIVQGLEKGSKIDFYFFDYVDGNKLIASGYVVKSGANKSMVKITKKFDKKRVDENTLARGGLLKD